VGGVQAKERVARETVVKTTVKRRGRFFFINNVWV
jgi:hypothetical protein